MLLYENSYALIKDPLFFSLIDISQKKIVMKNWKILHSRQSKFAFIVNLYQKYFIKCFYYLQRVLDVQNNKFIKTNEICYFIFVIKKYQYRDDLFFGTKCKLRKSSQLSEVVHKQSVLLAKSFSYRYPISSFFECFGKNWKNQSAVSWF